MAGDLIRYDLLVQEAMRSVVRGVLAAAARDGLPGDHHFYITFRTHAPGVRLSERMRDRYPDEMTIVLQHQFWDLAVTHDAFEVGLSFQGIAEKLAVPFEAITSFADPAAEFGLRFALAEEAAEMAQGEPVAPTQAPVHPPMPNPLPDPLEGAAQAQGTDLGAEAERGEPGEPKVVSIDAFRRKS